MQLVLLPALMCGQALSNVAADARASKTFEDIELAKQNVERVLDLLSLETKGGLADVMANIDDLKAALPKSKRSTNPS